jgi:hypothetical protein
MEAFPNLAVRRMDNGRVHRGQRMQSISQKSVTLGLVAPRILIDNMCGKITVARVLEAFLDLSDVTRKLDGFARCLP